MKLNHFLSMNNCNINLYKQIFYGYVRYRIDEDEAKLLINIMYFMALAFLNQIATIVYIQGCYASGKPRKNASEVREIDYKTWNRYRVQRLPIQMFESISLCLNLFSLHVFCLFDCFQSVECLILILFVLILFSLYNKRRTPLVFKLLLTLRQDNKL